MPNAGGATTPTVPTINPFGFDQLPNAIQPGPEQPIVEVPQSLIGPLAEIQIAKEAIELGFRRLSIASSAESKKRAAKDLENQATILIEALGSYAAALD